MKRVITRRNIWAVLVFLILNIGLSLRANCQPGDPGGDPDVPISGIEWLMVAGGIFGARKVYKNIKKNQR